jgi:serine phosphatase RsbU (regulator of sigma subunit)
LVNLSQKRGKSKNAAVANELVRCIPQFALLPDTELEDLAVAVRETRVAEDTLLLREGNQEGHFYILIEGEVEIIKALGTDDERLLAVRTPCSLLGELSLFSEDGTHTASVRARTDLRLMELPGDVLNGLLQRQPAFAYEMIRTLSSRLVEGEDRTIRDLRRKNRELLQAYRELEAAQEQIIEKERMERELQVARDIQMSILPRAVPDVEGLAFGTHISPMAAVGGDFYDIIKLDDGRLAIVIGDVSDHGVPAALFMALTVTLLRAELRRGTAPLEVLQRVNRHMLEMNETGMFVTALLGILDPEARHFRYARAGHEPPIILGVGGEFVPVDRGRGQPLGLFPDLHLDEQHIPMPNGCLLLLYTDGVTEAMDETGLFFGLPRVEQLMLAGASTAPQGLCDRLWDSLQEHRGPTVQHDDVTMLAVKVD